MTRDVVFTEAAAQPRGAYSQAVKGSGLIFAAGQLPLDAGGNLIGDGDIDRQTTAALANMATILHEAGSSMDKVVKTTVFLTSIDDFGGMNAAYERSFSAPYPARSTVEIGRLPKGMLVEIECIALA